MSNKYLDKANDAYKRACNKHLKGYPPSGPPPHAPSSAPKIDFGGRHLDFVQMRSDLDDIMKRLDKIESLLEDILMANMEKMMP